MSADSRGGSAGVRRLVLVVGIGRSGTSLFAGILRQLGFHVPQPEVKADDTNPRGFNEPRWVVDFHSRLLRQRRVTVFDSRPAAWRLTAEAADDDEAFDDLRSWLAVQFVGTENVVVKDPRIGWFLPLWLRCADDLGVRTSFATMLRHPPEVVRSAREWYGTWQADASRAAAWLNHTLETESATRGALRAFVRYDELLDDWGRELARVGERLEIPWLASIDRSRHPEVDAFVDPTLRRSAAAWDDVKVPATLRSMVDDVWREVSRLAESGGDEPANHASLDAARSAYHRFYADAEAIAQSSVTAVKPRRGLSATSSPRVKASANSRPDGRLRRIARVLPSPGGESLATPARLADLPLRLAFRIPPRYRERIPVPVVRAGLRMVRALRR